MHNSISNSYAENLKNNIEIQTKHSISNKIPNSNS